MSDTRRVRFEGLGTNTNRPKSKRTTRKTTGIKTFRPESTQTRRSKRTGKSTPFPTRTKPKTTYVQNKRRRTGSSPKTKTTRKPKTTRNVEMETEPSKTSTKRKREIEFIEPTSRPKKRQDRSKKTKLKQVVRDLPRSDPRNILRSKFASEDSVCAKPLTNRGRKPIPSSVGVRTAYIWTHPRTGEERCYTRNTWYDSQKERREEKRN